MFEFFSLKETLTATMVLFAVIDIIGSIPIIVSLKQKFGHIESEKAAIVSGILMISFLFIGNKILKFIGVDVNSDVRAHGLAAHAHMMTLDSASSRTCISPAGTCQWALTARPGCA